MTPELSTVFVVDDDPMIAGYLNDLLSEAGYTVRVARGGQEALDRLNSPERDEIDLVLLDVIMPDIDGYTVCQRLRSLPQTERLLIIMVTGRDKPSEKTHGLDLGADDYIAKPFDPLELLARVKAMFRLHHAERELRARNQALAALNAVSQTIGRAVELPDVLSSALEQVLTSLELSGGAIALQSLNGPQAIAVQRAPSNDFVPDLDLIEQTAQAAQAVIRADTAGVPLISRNHVLGALYVTGLTHPTPQTLDLLSAIGSQIGAAIERARLYQDVQQRSEDLAVLNEITRAVTSSLELDRVLTTSLHSIRQVLHVEAGSLVLIDAESSERRYRNTQPELEAWLRQDATQDNGGILGLLAALREPVVIKDSQALKAGEIASLKLRNLLAAPLIAKSRLLGALVVVNRVEGTFTSDDLELLQFLAAAIAVATENARLYGELADFAHELERSQVQLVQAEKLAATGRLAASLAHEINNPLQSIHNCLYLVLNRTLPDDKQGYYLNMAQTEVERLITLVQRTLEFYRPSQGRRVSTHVNRLIENVLALAHKQLEHSDITVETHLPGDLPEIAVLPDQLTQVFMNLIINAIEAMPQGGKLFVSTLADDQGLSIVIEDSGVGIRSDDAAKIFEPFFTTKSSGTGLGLAVSYGIIQQHGGRIDVTSIPEEGTTFTIWLPLDRPGGDDNKTVVATLR